MKGSKYRDLTAWKAARVLARNIYVSTRRFPRDEQFGMTQQMRRAAVSIMSNIAEGFGRSTDSDRKHFCIIARGSALEIESQLVIAEDVGYLTHEAAERLTDLTLDVARLLNGLIRYLTRH